MQKIFCDFRDKKSEVAVAVNSSPSLLVKLSGTPNVVKSERR